MNRTGQQSGAPFAAVYTPTVVFLLVETLPLMDQTSIVDAPVNILPPKAEISKHLCGLPTICY